MLKGYCHACDAWHTPTADWHGQVLGQGRFRVRLCSLIAYLHTPLRLLAETIQTYLQTVHDLSISTGGNSGILAQVRRAGMSVYRGLLAAARASPAMHGDETG